MITDLTALPGSVVNTDLLSVDKDSAALAVVRLTIVY